MQKTDSLIYAFLLLFTLHNRNLNSMDRDTLKTTAIISGVVVGGYALGYLAAQSRYEGINGRYKKTINLIDNDSESGIRRELPDIIRHDNVYYPDKSSPFRNYPQVQYKKDLDDRIRSLNNLWYFTLGTELSSKITNLIADLKRITHFVITSPTYIAERRAAEEYIEYQKTLVLVHTGIPGFYFSQKI